MMRINKFILAAVLILFFSTSNAALVAYWEYDDPNPVVGPTDTIELRATIYNDFSSDSRLVCCDQSAGGAIGGVIASSGHSWGSLLFYEPVAPSNPYDALTRFDLGLPGTL
jgi:hypothetical protein